MEGNQEALGTKFRCFGRPVQNGRTFRMFREEEMVKLLPKTVVPVFASSKQRRKRKFNVVFV